MTSQFESDQKVVVVRRQCKLQAKREKVKSDEGLSLETSANIHTFGSSPPFLFWPESDQSVWKCPVYLKATDHFETDLSL